MRNSKEIESYKKKINKNERATTMEKIRCASKTNVLLTQSSILLYSWSTTTIATSSSSSGSISIGSGSSSSNGTVGSKLDRANYLAWLDGAMVVISSEAATFFFIV